MHLRNNINAVNAQHIAEMFGISINQVSMLFDNLQNTTIRDDNN